MYRAILIFFIVISSTHAQTHMCKRDGQVVFQDTPCDSSLTKTDGALCTGTIGGYQSLIDSGKATIAEKMCYSKLMEDKKQAEKEARTKAENEHKMAERKIKEEQREKAREEYLTNQLREKREAEERRNRTIQQAKADGRYYVEYAITGETYAVNITMRNANGDLEQHKVMTGWRYGFDGRRGQILYLSGQNQRDFGDVGVQIFVNGELVKSASSTADYGVATVSGKL